MDFLVDDMFISRKQNEDSESPGIPGYLIRSKARANVDDPKDFKQHNNYGKLKVQTIINHLYANSQKNTQSSEDMGIVIAIHGYNTGSTDIDLDVKLESDDDIKDGVWKYWYQNLNKFINHVPVISQKSDSLIFLGYRWPSESVKGENFRDSLIALPFLLKSILWGSLFIGFISLFLFFWLSSPLFIFPMIVGTFGFTLVFSLLIMRVIVYFRDSYRATNYGVNDLVELIRQIDQGLINCYKNDELHEKKQSDEDANTYWNKKRIKLSFIGHSMGGYVTTQVVRILSDIFDSDSIGNFNEEETYKKPSSLIGRVFSLGRLILVSPDIPVLTITSGRANFLRSSLRRFEEAYLFSNEGDLALRLASTAANYFSFPAKKRIHGYRLGNVTVRRKKKQSSKTQKQKGRHPSEYGILNLKDKELCKWNDKELRNLLPKMNSLLDYLEVNLLNQTESHPLDLVDGENDHELISNLFTYFDCTEYKDLTDYPPKDSVYLSNEHFVMNVDEQISPFNFLEYLQLGWAYLIFSIGKPFGTSFERNGRDVHGGYFWGKFSQQLMYCLAFVGFQEFLDSFLTEQTVIDTLCSNNPPLNREQAKRLMALQKLSEIMECKQMQTVLSPERYLIDVMGEEDRQKVRKQILMFSN
ncbi:MAG: alpha/beta hydrolase [Rhizonema sp. PD37]|nr:alpha/beta hydrolase [Rhizonema sp. PD37]